jgi:LacI family transcriptional regulator
VNIKSKQKVQALRGFMGSDRQKRATVHDLAKHAGVSLATIDRVLNKRPGVRQATTEKVEAAIRQLNFSRDVGASLMARARDVRVTFIFPDGNNNFMRNLIATLEQQIKQWSGKRLTISIIRSPALNDQALVKILTDIAPKNSDCLVMVGTNTQAVRDAIDHVVKREVPVVTLVSDLPSSNRHSFVGIDNYAAGRTAGSLMGRFFERKTKIGLLLGSHTLRDHQQRLAGFQHVIQEEFTHLQLIDPIEGHDRAADTERAVLDLLHMHPDLSGIYSMGAGNSGLIAALAQRAGKNKIRVIAHELTEVTRDALIAGSIDIVLDQNPEHEIRAALEIAQNLGAAKGSVPQIAPDPILINIFLRDNL